MTGHYITVITVAKVDATQRKSIRKFILYIYKYIYNIIYITIPSLDTGWRKTIVSNCNDCNVMGMLQDPVQYYPRFRNQKTTPISRPSPVRSTRASHRRGRRSASCGDEGETLRKGAENGMEQKHTQDFLGRIKEAMKRCGMCRGDPCGRPQSGQGQALPLQRV